MSNSNSDHEEPQLVFQRIGSGSFATIYVRSGTRIAYKQVHRANEGNTLRIEYGALNKIYTLCTSDSFFYIPRALAFYDPQLDLFLAHLPSPTSVSQHRHAPRPVMKQKALLSFSSAVYAMERIFHLPECLASTIASNFYPEQHRNQPGPRLCRLYLGKVIDGVRPSRFFNSANFPLDATRYKMLQIEEELEPVEDVAHGMGEMIGRIHWHGGFDARDIEFVLGGDGFEDHAFYIIDFNQMRPWSKTSADVSVLVDAHYLNDPYFPRARLTDPLYLEFRRGYISAYPQLEECMAIAETFLQAIETKQAERDAATGPGKYDGGL